ncbi:MAG TPA: MFS transporter, partial [Saprospiraceae bacterium]|nr:MFS transporter [Saprospiraceae bacterium]
MKNKALYTLLLTIFIDLLGFSIIIPILPVYSKELGASNIMVGIIAGSYALMNFIFSPILGNLSDRIGRKPVILVSLLITAFSYLLFSFATAIPLLIVSRIIAGIGSANMGTAQAYITDITKPEDRAKAFGKIGAAFGLGFIIGPLIGGLILKTLGVVYIGYVTMSLNILNFILAAFILKESNHDKKTTRNLFENPFKSVMETIKRPMLGKLMLISLLFITAFSMMQITISVYWNEKYALNKAQISDMFAFIGISIVFVQGFLVERLNKKFGEYKLLIIGCILMAIGLYLLPTAPYERWFYVVEGFAILV